MSARYIIGDTRDVLATIPDGSIDLVLTSPPFLALRSYLPADHPDKHREIGSEPDPATFLDTLLHLTADWRRVLAASPSSTPWAPRSAGGRRDRPRAPQAGPPGVRALRHRERLQAASTPR